MDQRDQELLDKQLWGVSPASPGNYEGLIYTRIGDVKITGGGHLTGTIISGGDVEKSGGSTAFAWKDCRPIPPGEPDAPLEAELTVWQK